MTHRRALILAGLLGLLALSLLTRALWPHLTEDRSLFRELQRGEFHPSFFLEHARAVRQNALWPKDSRAVAVAYAGATRLCPISQLKQLSATPERAVYIIVNQCWAGVFAAKKWRVDLVLTDGNWDIEWSGVTYKCSRKLTDPGTLLVSNNPLRLVRAPWAVGVNRAVRAVGYQLNPWQTTCPP